MQQPTRSTKMQLKQHTKQEGKWSRRTMESLRQDRGMNNTHCHTSIINPPKLVRCFTIPTPIESSMAFSFLLFSSPLILSLLFSSSLSLNTTTPMTRHVSVVLVVASIFVATCCLVIGGAKAQTCDPTNRMDCGFIGITQQQCQQKGCCWNPVNPNPNNLPFCFYTTASNPPGYTCNASGDRAVIITTTTTTTSIEAEIDGWMDFKRFCFNLACVERTRCRHHQSNNQTINPIDRTNYLRTPMPMPMLTCLFEFSNDCGVLCL
jgi:hypothetical protein